MAHEVHPDFNYDLDVELVGIDSNAGAIMGAIMRSLRKAGYDKEVIDDYSKKCFSGNYDELLALSMEYAGY